MNTDADFWVALVVCLWVTAIFGICMWRIRKDTRRAEPKVDALASGDPVADCRHETMRRVSWAPVTWICVQTPACHYEMSGVNVDPARTIYHMPLNGQAPEGSAWFTAKRGDVFVDSSTGQTWVK